MRAAFVRREWENQAQTVLSVYFRPASRYRYEAGQYASVTIPHDQPDNRGDNRVMTLSSSPDDELLKITMRIYGPDGANGSSYKRAIMKLRPNDAVTIQESMGDLVLPLDASIPFVFVAGGIGIASFVGMVQRLSDHSDQRDITLLYAVARQDDIILQKPFETYGAVYPLTSILHTPDVNTAHAFNGKIEHTRLTAQDIKQYIRPNSLVYLSGPETFVAGLLRDLLADGVPRGQIVFDYFDGYVGL